jgi:hypothetical protein
MGTPRNEPQVSIHNERYRGSLIVWYLIVSSYSHNLGTALLLTVLKYTLLKVKKHFCLQKRHG